MIAGVDTPQDSPPPPATLLPERSLLTETVPSFSAAATRLGVENTLRDKITASTADSVSKGPLGLPTRYADPPWSRCRRFVA